MKITHIAWLGHKNYGDDIMAVAVRKYLAGRYHDVAYTIWCEGRPETGANLKWIYPFAIGNKYFKDFFENRALKKTDLLLIGGGAILHSAISIEWKQRGIDFLRQKKPAARAVGINLSLGPFSHDAVKLKCRTFLKSLDAASFRDLYSYEFARESDLPYEPVLSFDLTASYFEFFNIREKLASTEIKCIGISIREPYGASDTAGIFNNYTSLIKRLAESYERIVLFAFCTSTCFGDVKFIERIRNKIPLKNIEIVPYRENALSFTEHIRVCDFFISTRLHGTIVAFLLNIPFIGISYHKKCDDFMQYIGIPGQCMVNQAEFSAADILARIQAYQLPDQARYRVLAAKNFTVFNNVPARTRLHE